MQRRRLWWLRLDFGMRASIYALAFFLPFSVSGSQIALGVMIVLQLAIWGVTRKVGWRWDPLYVPLALFLGGVFVSMLFSIDPALSWIKGSKYWIVAIYFLVINHLYEERRVRTCLLILVYTTAAVAVYSVIFQHFLGLDPLRVLASPTKLFQKTGSYYHAVGLFDHHLTYGNSLMIVLFLALALIVSSRSHWERILLGAGFLVTLAGLFYSYARGPWLGFLAGCFLYGYVKGRRVLVLLLAVALLAGAAFYMGSDSVRHRIRTIFDSNLNVERIITWQTTMEMIKDYPVVGLGPGVYRRICWNYRDGYNVHFTSESHAHNAYLQVWAESGLFGFVPYVLVLVVFLYYGVRRMYDKLTPQPARELTLGGVAAVMAFCVAGLFQHNLGDAEVAMLVWFVAAIVLRKDRRTHVELGYLEMSVREKT